MRETEILRGLGKAKSRVQNLANGSAYVHPAMATPRETSFARSARDFSNGTAYIDGPGTETSDSIPANLSKGEAVLPARTVRALGSQNIARLIEETNGVPPEQIKAGGSYALGGISDAVKNGYNKVKNSMAGTTGSKTTASAPTVDEWSGYDAPAFERPEVMNNINNQRSTVGPQPFKAAPSMGVADGIKSAYGTVEPRQATPNMNQFSGNNSPIARKMNAVTNAVTSSKAGRAAGALGGGIQALSGAGDLADGVSSGNVLQALDGATDVAAGGAVASGNPVATGLGLSLTGGKLAGSGIVSAIDAITDFSGNKAADTKLAEQDKRIQDLRSRIQPPTTPTPPTEESGVIGDPKQIAGQAAPTAAPAVTEQQTLRNSAGLDLQKLVDMATRSSDVRAQAGVTSRGVREQAALAQRILGDIIQADTARYGADATLRSAQAKAAPTAMDMAKNEREAQAAEDARMDNIYKDMAKSFGITDKSTPEEQAQLAEFKDMVDYTAGVQAEQDPKGWLNAQTGKPKNWQELDQGQRSLLKGLYESRNAMKKAGSSLLSLGSEFQDTKDLMQYQPTFTNDGLAKGYVTPSGSSGWASDLDGDGVLGSALTIQDGPTKRFRELAARFGNK